MLLEEQSSISKCFGHLNKILSLSQIFWLTEESGERSSDTDGDSFHNNKQTWIMLILKHAANI